MRRHGRSRAVLTNAMGVSACGGGKLPSIAPGAERIVFSSGQQARLFIAKRQQTLEQTLAFLRPFGRQRMSANQKKRAETHLAAGRASTPESSRRNSVNKRHADRPQFALEARDGARTARNHGGRNPTLLVSKRGLGAKAANHRDCTKVLLAASTLKADLRVNRGSALPPTLRAERTASLSALSDAPNRHATKPSHWMSEMPRRPLHFTQTPHPAAPTRFGNSSIAVGIPSRRLSIQDAHSREMQ